MAQYMLILVSALVIALGVMPTVRQVAIQRGFIDQPSARKVHTRPIPRLGGAAIYVGCIAALVAFGNRFYVSQFVSILAGASLMSFMGLWDDRQGLPPLVKLLGQLLATGALIVAGVRVGFMHRPILDLAATFLWVVGHQRAQPARQHGRPVGGCRRDRGASSWCFPPSRPVPVGQPGRGARGRCIGFLFTLQPGQHLHGRLAAASFSVCPGRLGIKLRFPRQCGLCDLDGACRVLGLPVFDTTLVAISRLRRGLNPLTTPGKDHVSHRLVASGATQREAVLILYLVCCALGVIAMFLTQASRRGLLYGRDADPGRLCTMASGMAQV